MIALDAARLGQHARRMIEALGGITAEPGRMTRLYLSPEHKRANALVARWMAEIGLEVEEDALGSVHGRWRGRTAGTNRPRRLILGSHLDTVVDGGLYDGNLGVVAAILAVGTLAGSGVTLPFDVDIYGFGEEEGVRFPITYATSRGVAGAFDRTWLDRADRDGVTLGAALDAFGKDPDRIGEAAFPADEAAAYVEVHIEQGPVLEMRRQPLGVVTAIVGQSRLTLTVSGEAGHAGTVPMGLRRDAFVAAAEMTLALEALARSSPDVVATIGRVAVEPGAVNVVPSRVVCSVDIRAPGDEERAETASRFRAAVREIAERRDVSATLSPYAGHGTTPCAPSLQDGLARAVAAIGGEPVRLASGAGHDGQAMHALCPIGMMFVRCRGGVSHNPAEYCAPEDMGAAVAALVRFIEGFSPDAG